MKEFKTTDPEFYQFITDFLYDGMRQIDGRF